MRSSKLHRRQGLFVLCCYTFSFLLLLMKNTFWTTSPGYRSFLGTQRSYGRVLSQHLTLSRSAKREKCAFTVNIILDCATTLRAFPRFLCDFVSILRVFMFKNNFLMHVVAEDGRYCIVKWPRYSYKIKACKHGFLRGNTCVCVYVRTWFI